MIYRYTIDNILSLMQNMGTLKREQIKRFFSSELEPNRVEYLQRLCDQYDGNAICLSTLGTSKKAKEILDEFESYSVHFKKIIPGDYEKMMAAIAKYEKQGQAPEDAKLSAFNEIVGH